MLATDASPPHRSIHRIRQMATMCTPRLIGGFLDSRESYFIVHS